MMRHSERTFSRIVANRNLRDQSHGVTCQYRMLGVQEEEDKMR